MEKSVLLKKINGEYTKDQLVSWVSSLPGSTGTKKPDISKVGDVYMHPIFGHPYVLLQKNKGSWLCGMLTSNGDCEEVLEQCKSRFFTTSYITKNLLHITGSPVGSWANVYDNNKHLKEVLVKLRTIFNQ